MSPFVINLWILGWIAGYVFTIRWILLSALKAPIHNDRQ